MKKEELKSFDIVEDICGCFYLTVVDGDITFLHKTNGATCFDFVEIKRVFRGQNDNDFCVLWVVLEKKLSDASKSFDIIWERPLHKEMTVAQIEKELGYTIKVVK